jgi:hypothetical protein
MPGTLGRITVRAIRPLRDPLDRSEPPPPPLPPPVDRTDEDDDEDDEGEEDAGIGSRWWHYFVIGAYLNAGYRVSTAAIDALFALAGLP